MRVRVRVGFEGRGGHGERSEAYRVTHGVPGLGVGLGLGVGVGFGFGLGFGFWLGRVRVRVRARVWVRVRVKVRGRVRIRPYGAREELSDVREVHTHLVLGIGWGVRGRVLGQGVRGRGRGRGRVLAVGC